MQRGAAGNKSSFDTLTWSVFTPRSDAVESPHFLLLQISNLMNSALDQFWARELMKNQNSIKN